MLEKYPHMFYYPTNEAVFKELENEIKVIELSE
jgi:hypothetical protein